MKYVSFFMTFKLGSVPHKKKSRKKKTCFLSQCTIVEEIKEILAGDVGITISNPCKLLWECFLRKTFTISV